MTPTGQQIWMSGRLVSWADANVHVLTHALHYGTGVFDSLPHCGAVITLLSICKLTHKESYLNLGAMTIVVPLIALTAVIGLGTVFGSF